ncbi:MAG: RNA polymerase sigma factor [Jatrophihabitantaceae bacterium]
MTASEVVTEGECEQSAPADSDARWIAALSGHGPEHQEALRRLHELMLRGAEHQIAQMYHTLPKLGTVRIEDIVRQSADEATVAVLAKLATFQGRSRFTTWAYKFAILHAAVEVRRNMWRHREVTLDLLYEPYAPGASPEQVIAASDFSSAVSAAIDQGLTSHQREIVLALLVEDVPIDVLAERLGSTRNALHKTLHDARQRLRRHLTAQGYLAASSPTEVNS